MAIVKANIEHLKDLVPLFDQYRIFYRQESDKKGAEKFLFKRLNDEQSIIFLAYDENKPIGFTQLYFLYSSVSMEPMMLLNDLFVDKAYRGQNIGTLLIERAKQYCRQTDQKGMAIQTERSNKAQNLYLRLGFVEDPDLHFFWSTK